MFLPSEFERRVDGSTVSATRNARVRPPEGVSEQVRFPSIKRIWICESGLYLRALDRRNGVALLQAHSKLCRVNHDVSRPQGIARQRLLVPLPNNPDRKQARHRPPQAGAKVLDNYVRLDQHDLPALHAV